MTPDLQGVSSIEQMLMDAIGQGAQPSPGTSLPGQTEPPTGPPPSPFDQYEQRVMEQMNNTTPESIYQDKVKEYYKDLGVNPNSKIGKLVAHLHEAGLSMQANANRPINQTSNLYNDYQGPIVRLRDSAQKEYEKTYPNIKSAGQEIFRLQRERERTSEQDTVSRRKEENAAEAIRSKERIASMKDAVERLQIPAKNGNLEAQALVKKYQAEILKQDAKTYEDNPFLKQASPALRDAMIGNTMQGEPGGEAKLNNTLSIMSDMKNMTNPVNDFSVALKADPGTFSRYLNNRREEERIKNQFKPIPTSGTQIIQTNEKTPDGVVEGARIIDKRTGQTTPIDFGGAGGPRNKSQIDLDRDASQTEANAVMAHGTLLGQIQDGTADKISGVSGGNPISVLARKLGYPAPSGASERELEQWASNTMFKHSRTMMGSARIPLQVLDSVSGLIGKQSYDKETRANALGGLVYSAKLIKAVNSGEVKVSELESPAVARQIGYEIQQATEKAKVDRLTGKKRDIKLPSIRSIVDGVKIATGQGTDTTAETESEVTKRLHNRYK